VRLVRVKKAPAQPGKANPGKMEDPRLLHQLRFSVQRPRKRLARADKAAQERWLTKRLPAIRGRLSR
jgi:hypothetical protein